MFLCTQFYLPSPHLHPVGLMVLLYNVVPSNYVVVGNWVANYFRYCKLLNAQNGITIPKNSYLPIG